MAARFSGTPAFLPVAANEGRLAANQDRPSLPESQPVASGESEYTSDNDHDTYPAASDAVCSSSPVSPSYSHAPPAPSRNADCIYIPVRIGDANEYFLVDTGSAATIVSHELWSRLKINAPLQRANPLRTVTSSPLHIVGATILPLQIGQQQFSQSVFVAQHVQPPCILGRDFLAHHACSVDLSAPSLVVDGISHPLSVSRPSSGTDAVAPVRVTLPQTVIIHPYSEIVLSVDLPVPQHTSLAGSTGVISGRPNFLSRSGLDSSRVLATVVDGHVPIRLANFGPSSVTIYANTSVGEFQSCDPTDVLDGSATDSGPVPAVDTVATAEEADDPLASADLAELFHLSDNPNLDDEQRSKALNLLHRYRHLFAQQDTPAHRTHLVTHSIDTANAHPIKLPPRRISPHMADTVQQELNSMLDADVIQPSNSPWAAPVVLVRKKNGGVRFCIDYRKLNAVTVQDAHPIPRMDDTLDCLAGARLFSTLDLKSGYWQIPMADDDKCKTAFSTPYGLYQFNVMPFGLVNAPATFQRLMHMVLAGLEWKTCLAYMDDINTFSTTVNEHLDRLEEVFSRLSEAGLTLNPAKCSLFRSSVGYLGHVISGEGVATDPSKISTVVSWPTPSCSKDLSSFLGLASYYRRFVPNFASIAAPLFCLTRKGKEFHWTSDCQHAFECLKALLTAAPILAYPDFTRPFVLDTDASDTGIGAVLSQVHDDGREHVIAYGSHPLTKSQRNYSTTRKELLAVVTFVESFRHYLLYKPFTIRTDHGSLQWLHNFKEPNGQLARWIERLADYTFTIEHRPGKSHRNADTLSRRPEHDSLPSTVPQPSIVAAIAPSDTDPTPMVTSTDHSWMPAWTTNEVRSSQTAHPVWAHIIECLEHSTQPQPSHPSLVGINREHHELLSEFPRLELHNSLLFRRFTDACSEVSHLQLVVPPPLQQAILDTSHSHSTGGHLGPDRMKHRIATDFYWPGWRTAVTHYCRQCVQCARRKTPPSKPAPLQSTHSGYPWERLAIDILGPLPKTERGSQYVLVCADYFTKWTEALPMPDMTARTVATKLYDNIICRFGVPTMIHSDQGRQFESQLFQELCRVLDVTKTRTTPYHPQSDGMVERFNRTLLTMLSSFVNSRHDDWDVHLQSVMFAYRTTVHSGTGYTPYFLQFGREAQLPISAMFPVPRQQYSQVPYVAERQQALHDAFSRVRQRLQAGQQRQKTLFDRKAADKKFPKSQLVWLHQPAIRPGTSPKFHRPWDGPYRIINKLSPVVVRLQHCSHPSKTPVVHVDRLKACHLDPASYPTPVHIPQCTVPPPPQQYSPADHLQYVQLQPAAVPLPNPAPAPVPAPPVLAPAGRPPRQTRPPAWHAAYHIYR